jgi:hypothetical protein
MPNSERPAKTALHALMAREGRPVRHIARARPRLVLAVRATGLRPETQEGRRISGALLLFVLLRNLALLPH